MSGGRPVLLIHGAWHAGWAWEGWLPLLAERGYRPVAMDLRGHGAAPGSYRGAGVGDYLEDVERAIATLDAPPILVGHSLGGLLIQHLMAERVHPAAVLLAPIPGRYPARMLPRFGLRHPLVMARATLRNDLRPFVSTPRLVRETLFTDATPEEVVAATQGRLTGAWPGLFREMVRTAPPAPWKGTPTLVIAPGDDAGFTVPMQRRLAQRLGAELAEVEGAGHDVPVDGPWREAATLVGDWLQRTAPSDRGHAARTAFGAPGPHSQ